MFIALSKKYALIPIRAFIKRFIGAKPSKARRESNLWLMRNALNIKGHVLSIGSGSDTDGEGRKYRDYFKQCSSYTTSEVTAEFECDLVLDVRTMPQIQNESYDCVYCSGVLEHVDNHLIALKEITRILKTGGILLLGLPFRQALHMPPNDYWRFTEYAIRYMLQNDYEILDLVSIDNSVPNFPATYWVKARKKDKY